MKRALLFLLAAGSLLAHSATLVWTDTLNAAGAATYNVYRLIGSCPVTNPTSLTGFAQVVANVTAKTYTDSSVAAATTYAYVVTAVAAGSESVPSNCMQAVIPANTFPPVLSPPVVN